MIPYQLHQKLRSAQQQGTSSSSNLSILKGLPFWIWDKEQHRQQAAATNGNCCIQHVLGLPIKDRREFPLFDYEKLLYDSLLPVSGGFKDKHLWVKKATGLGVTEFMLRMIAWLYTKDYQFVNAQICIVTGPNKDLAIKLIKRLKGIFEPKLGLVFSDKETVTKFYQSTGEEPVQYVRGPAREVLTIPWDKKKANELLTSEKIFGEDSINITNISEVQYIVKFPYGNPARTAFEMQDFLDFKYEKLQELSRTIKSPYLADLERRVNPYK